MTSRASEAVRLLAAVDAEAALSVEHRRTRASDADLANVRNVLAIALNAEAGATRQGLRGRISHIVVDTWSFDAALSDELVTFDDRFLTTG